MIIQELSFQGEGKEVALPGFTGQAEMLVTGLGPVALLRSIDRGISYHVATDDAGYAVEFVGGGTEVLYNSQISNDCQAVRFKLESDTPIKVELIKC